MTKIKVALRLRPISQCETDEGYPVVVSVKDDTAFITDIRVPERPSADSRPRYRKFHFDHSFSLDDVASIGASQSDVYIEMGPPLENSLFQGYNACLLAYGQSGTGKTHTMLGSREDPGIIPRLCQSIWRRVLGEDGMKTEVKVEVSFTEIYREKVRDLLSPDRRHLKVREHPQLGPHVQDLRRIEIQDEGTLLDLLWEGEGRRASGRTGSNQRSSRSHAIWTIYLTREQQIKKKDDDSINTNRSVITSQVHLVDLAGSEKAGFSTAKTLIAEGADINRSLVALGNVISALAEKAQYVPYRDSALTWLLKDSLGGNATTAIIITASPASSCHAQTLNSFRFAERARQVENRPVINANLGNSLRSFTSPSALYSIMSAFEMKKDISKLSKLIRTAQNNGGLLRGLTSTPRASWTRLCSALEGWNAIEGEHLKREARSSSIDASTSTSTTSATSAVREETTSTSRSSSPSSHSVDTLYRRGRRTSDAVTQADLNLNLSTKPKVTPRGLFYGDGNGDGPHLQAATTASEVFIPVSSSIKCLTWRQEEVIKPPKKEEAVSTSSDKASASSVQRRSSLSLLLPLQFPVPSHLEISGRISERIHRTLAALPKRETIWPRSVEEILDKGFFPQKGFQHALIRERVPTLVQPSLIPLKEALKGPSPSFSRAKTCPAVPVYTNEEEEEDEIEEDKCEGPSRRLIGKEKQQQREELLKEQVPSEILLREPSKVQIFQKVQEENFQLEAEEVPLKKVLRLVKNEDKQLSTKISEDEGEKEDPSSFSTPGSEPLITPVFEEVQPQDLLGEEYQVEDRKMRLISQNGEVQQKRCFFKARKMESSLSPIFEDEDVSNSSRSRSPPQVFASQSDSEFIEEEEDDDFSSSETSSGSWNFSRFDHHSQHNQQDFFPGITAAGPTSSSTRIREEEEREEDVPVPVLVRVLPEEKEMEEFRRECVEEWVRDPETRVSTLMVGVERRDQLPLEEEAASSGDGDHSEGEESSSKFRSHFSRELSEMEKIGQQLKQLQAISQQCHKLRVVEPFINKILSLEEEDHFASDPVLDPEIEECSGWNLATEVNLVNKELLALNKALRFTSAKGKGSPVTPSNTRRESMGSTKSSNSGTGSTLPSSSSAASSLRKINPSYSDSALRFRHFDDLSSCSSFSLASYPNYRTQPTLPPPTQQNYNYDGYTFGNYGHPQQHHQRSYQSPSSSSRPYHHHHQSPSHPQYNPYNYRHM